MIFVQNYTSHRSALVKLLLLAGIIGLFCACSSAPPEQDYAEDYRANLQYVTGKPYQHAVYVNSAAFAIQTNEQQTDQPEPLLHVYIEGDGKAFDQGKVTTNPTPDNPLLLKLMAKDNQPAIYLGRPCYFNPSDDLCSPNVWTRQRYSQQVVTSMAGALQQFSQPYRGIVLIGHSGGGTLAALMAAQVPHTKMLVTLAGNLDTFAWAVEHNYQHLKASLNPTDQPPLPEHIIQVHYAGADDAVIDPDWVQAFAEKQQRAEFHRLLAVNHIDGWEEFWPQVLDKLEHYQQFVESKPKPQR